MGDRSALIVAIGTYQDPELRQLRAPAQDAVALAEVLATSTIGGFQVRPVIDQPSHRVAHELDASLPAGAGRTCCSSIFPAMASRTMRATFISPPLTPSGTGLPRQPSLPGS